jgi:hypothetical protein
MSIAQLQIRKWALALAFCAYCEAPAHAQEMFGQPQARLLSRFAFQQLTGGVIIVKAQFNNFPDSLQFVLDTGSGGISLDSATAEELKLPLVKSDKTIRGIAGVRNVMFANNHLLRFPGLTVDSLNFHINDYELLSNVYGVKVDGIIGYAFLRRYLVHIDYNNMVLSVYSPGAFKYARGGHTLRPAIAGLPMLYCNLSEQRRYLARFYFDTGAGLCLLFNQDFVDDSTVFNGRKRRYPTMAEGLGGKKLMELTTLKFKNVPTYIFDDEFNVTSYPFLGGLIGNDLLRRFNVTINYPQSEIHLQPNNHYRDPFDYSYTGMGLFMQEGHVTVSDVMKDSPAEKAGLKEGDHIIGVGNDLSGNLQTYKQILQDSGRKVKLLYQRDGELNQTTLFIKSIR